MCKPQFEKKKTLMTGLLVLWSRVTYNKVFHVIIHLKKKLIYFRIIKLKLLKILLSIEIKLNII